MLRSWPFATRGRHCPVSRHVGGWMVPNLCQSAFITAQVSISVLVGVTWGPGQVRGAWRPRDHLKTWFLSDTHHFLKHLSGFSLSREAAEKQPRRFIPPMHGCSPLLIGWGLFSVCVWVCVWGLTRPWLTRWLKSRALQVWWPLPEETFTSAAGTHVAAPRKQAAHSGTQPQGLF